MPYYWSNNRDSSSRWSGGGGAAHVSEKRATQTESENSRCNPQTRRPVTQPVVLTPDLHRPTQRRNISTYFLSHTSCIPPCRAHRAACGRRVTSPPGSRLRTPGTVPSPQGTLLPPPPTCCVFPHLIPTAPFLFMRWTLTLCIFLNVNNELMCLTRMCWRSRPGGKTVIQVDLRRWYLEAESAAVQRQLEVWTGFLKGGTGK